MAEYWAHVERDADSLRGEECMHLGVAAQCEGANLVRLERIEGEGADKGHVHTQGAVLPSALYAQQGAVRDGDPGRVFQQRLAPGRVRLRLGGQGRAMASKVRRQAAMRGTMGAWLAAACATMGCRDCRVGALKASVVAGQLDNLDDLAGAKTPPHLRTFSDRLDTVGGEQKVAPSLALPLAA